MNSRKKKKKYTRRYSNNLKLEEVIDILDEVIDLYMQQGTSLSFNMMIMQRNITPRQLQYWERTYKEVKERLTELREIRKVRYENELLSETHLSSTNLVWYGKTHLGMVEESVKVKIDADKNIADNYNNTVLRIGFDSDENGNEYEE